MLSLSLIVQTDLAAPHMTLSVSLTHSICLYFSLSLYLSFTMASLPPQVPAHSHR